MKALLVDDDMQYIGTFLECAKRISDELGLELLCEANRDIGWVLKNWPGYDIFFLDIEMEGINGIELAEEIRRKDILCEIFFVSFHESYVYDTFGVRAGGFIRKKDLDADLHKVLRTVMERKLKEQSFAEIWMSNGGRLRIKPAEILYCQSEEHYVRFIRPDGASGVHRVKLDDVERALKEHDFLRVHERYLVNRAYIQTLQTKKLSMENGQEIPVSRSYKKKIQMILFDLKEH